MNKILLIDDDEDDQAIFKEALEIINPLLQCDIADNGTTALDKLKNGTSLPDIIFLDLNMPVMNGIEFLIQIKKEILINKIPIGIFTTSSTLKDKTLTKDLGAQFFLIKPNDFKVLCAKLVQVLGIDFTAGEYVSVT